MPAKPKLTRPFKVCQHCGERFYRPLGITNEVWNNRIACSVSHGAKLVWEKRREEKQRMSETPKGWVPALPDYLFRRGPAILRTQEVAMSPDRELCVRMKEADIRVQDLIDCINQPNQQVIDFCKSELR